MDVTIFGSRISPFVEKVCRALELKRIPFDIVEPGGPQDLRRWNRITGKMPVARIEGEQVIDSSFILRRIEKLQPSPALWSPDPGSAAAQRLIEDWCDESLYWQLMAMRWWKRNEKATAAQIAGSAPAPLRPLVGRLAPRLIGRSPRIQGFGRLPEAMLLEEFGARLDDLVALLDRRPFFFADRPGAADLALYGELHTGLSGPTPEVEALVGKRPALRDHMKRVEEATRPG